MSYRTIAHLALASAVLVWGAVWLRRSVASGVRYELGEDLRHTFLTPHRSYSAFFNDGRPRRIVPMILMISGAALLVWGLWRLR